MNDRKSDTDSSSRLEQLKDAGGRVLPMSPREQNALYDQLVLRTNRAPKQRRFGVLDALALGSALALAALLYVSTSQPSAGVNAPASRARATSAEAPLDAPIAASSPEHEKPDEAKLISLGGRGELRLAPNTVVTIPPEASAGGYGPLRVSLELGTLTVSVSPRGRDEPFSVVTPQVVIVVVGTRFSVHVDGQATKVSVEHGRVRVEKGAQSVLVSGGESVRSDDPRLTATVVRQTPVHREPVRGRAPAVCLPSSDVASQRACLQHAATGAGLGAENALLSLGLLERDQGNTRAAMARFREHRRRFPRGALAPEVALATIRALAARSERDAGCAVAADYARRFPTETKTSERLHAACAP